MKYSVDYEIVKYNVSCTTSSGEHVYDEIFYQEEKAVEFALEYKKTHPEIIINIYKIERVVALEEK